MAARSQQPYLDQATMAALVRFGPEIRGLQTLQRQAEATYASRLAQAAQQRKATRREVRRQTPVVGELFDDAETRMANVRGVVDQDLASLGPVPGSTAIREAIQLERLGSQNDLAEARAAELSGLQRLSRQAGQIERREQRGAQSDFVEAVTAILDQAQGLAAEQGAFQAATMGDLQEAARQRAQELRIARANNRNAFRIAELGALTDLEIARGDRRAARHQARAERRADRRADRRDYRQQRSLVELEARLDGDGRGGRDDASPKDYTGLRDDVASALQWAQYLKRSGAPRASAARTLLRGRQSQQVTANGQVVTRPAIPQTKQSVATLALDLAYDGAISNANRRMLKEAGYLRPRRLGYDFKPRPDGSPAAQGARSAGAALGALLDLLGA